MELNLIVNKEYLSQLYIVEKLSTRKIAKILGCGTTSITNYLKKYNIEIRTNAKYTKYSKNESFFEEINNESCYWAGFIAADGCIRPEKNRLQIGLSIVDIDLLNSFCINCAYTGKIFSYKASCELSIGQATKWILDLKENFNITPRKSLTLQPPNLTELEHKLAYIVGYIDGDGSIYNTKRNGIGLNIVGSQDIIKWISNTLSTIEDKKYQSLTVFKHKACNAYYLSCGNNRSKTLIEKLRNIHTPYKLARKWDKL